MRRGIFLILCICISILPAAASASIEIFNPLNMTYYINSSTANMRAIIDYNISGPATGAWLTLGDQMISIRKDSFIEYFELNSSDYNGKYSINSDIYNRFTYTFTAEPSGKGEAHAYLTNSGMLPNASPIDIDYSRSAGTGTWACLSNGQYKKLADGSDNTKYMFKVTGKLDGQYFTSYAVSINRGKSVECLIPRGRLTHINKIEVVSKDTGLSLSNQRMLAGSYYVELPAGSYVLRLFANSSGEVSFKSVSFTVAMSRNSSYSSCSDGTAEGNCSSTKPKYCYRSNLIDNCQECGCSSGYVCSGNGRCESPAATTSSTTAATATTSTAALTTTTNRATTSTAALTTTTGKAITTTSSHASTTSTTAAAQNANGGGSGVGKYYIFIIILVAFFVVVLYLLRKDMEELK